ncbi:PREDICTED: regulator of G-protein signaling 22 [Nanorana parkeri]|uniref:regulator of G-protein signaling 22 n=1 Tax=Nanorana parkeri TaxID=125878 RepID=UPI0008540D70|nr:PREDICTED: regulator of G-protein signaling 22 [Nanorana parkeri]
MGYKRLATGPPNITEDVFEDFLVTDDLLVDYFNEFLSLPTFTEAVKFNKTYGIFEVISDFPDQLNQQIKKLLREYQPPNPIYNATRSITGLKDKNSSSNDLQLNIDNNYNIMCLNREQGVQWVKKERLPAFLKSDCYFEYRLAKLMSQVKVRHTGVSLQLDPQYQPWAYKREVEPSPSPETENEELMRKYFVTLGQASFTQTKEWFTIANQNETTATTVSSSRPITWEPAQCRSSLYNGYHSNQVLQSASNTQTQGAPEEDEYSVSIAVSPMPSPVRIYIEQKQDKLPNKEQQDKGQENIPVFPTMEDFSFYYVDRVMKSAVSKLHGEKLEKSTDEIDVFSLSEVEIQPLQNTRTPSTTSESTIVEEIDISELDTNELDALKSSHNKHAYHHIHSQKEFERFKSFLKGTSGEKLFRLWMDVERLKAMTDIKRKQSHLNKMKKIYLVATGDHYLQTEVLMKLDLLDTNQWSENHLQSVQSEIVKRLLLYWGPRFCLADTTSANTVGADLKRWYDRQLRPKRDADPFPQTITMLPHRPKSCAPRISMTSSPVLHKSLTSPTETKSASFTRRSDSLISAKLKPGNRLIKSLPGSAVRSSQSRFLSCGNNAEPLLNSEQSYHSHHVDTSSSVLKSSKMEEMLQALHLDCRAGYFFATFCDQSGNKLWESGVNFWFDLQSYHHLFYQETLHPFKLCRQSQYIFGTYLAPSASMDICVEQNILKEIYQKLDPPFEDLFDSAEEYILTLLLSAWTQMTESDRQAYGKVELVEESRQLESAYYRKLQALQQEKASRKDVDKAQKSVFVPPPDIPKEPNLWELVPEEYRNYNLGTLVRHRMELEHFRSFLEDHFASMDLMCWIDLEQLRRMPHKDKEKRQEKSKDIKNKYLNKKYFFGPNSPATRDQQEQVMNLAGGWGKMLHDRLSSAVLVEIQKYVRMRIEKKWLPMFLSTEEYRERQKMQSQMKDVADDIIFQTNKKKLGVWKHLDSKWISSSKEIIAFRKALLNPITAGQFQRFISLKGDFFENGLLFWQEVQKYKELCHSHCDDATIQSKITAIINCFINSSIPPALQIDIPPEQAEKIIERRRDLGPYVFREAQMTIFSIMFKFWPEFCEFRRQLTDEKIVPLLERKKAKKTQQMKQKMREQEMLAKQQQEETKRKATLSDIYADNESSYSDELFFGREVYGQSRNVSWSYSKYLEALEQERILLKRQEDLEKKSGSSVISDNSSAYSIGSDDSKRSGKTFNSSYGQTQRLLSAARR